MRVPKLPQKLPRIPHKARPFLAAGLVAIVGTATVILSRAQQATAPEAPQQVATNTEEESKVLSKKKKAKPKPKKAPAKKPAATTAPSGSFKLAWQEDFASGGQPNSRYWNISTPAQPIYNGEAQKYSASVNNVRLSNGVLVLQARQSGGSFTSGRIDTMNKLKITQGSRLEARIRSAKGKGVWPAFWLLSDNQPYTDKRNPTPAMWEQERFYMWDGEIDIMEYYGYHPGIAESTVYTYGRTQEKTKSVPDIASAYHTYWLEWHADRLVFGVDGTAYHTFTKGSGSESDWPYTSANQMYVILNLAMGGSGGGKIVKSSSDKWTMEVDWVKYYKY